MRIDDRALEELSGLFVEERPVRDDLVAEAAVERGFVKREELDRVGRPVAASLLRLGRITAAQAAELARDAERRAVDRLVEDLRAGRPVEFPEGARVGKFGLVRELGRGRMARVWLAWDGALRRFVALKILSGQGAEDSARFRREARTAGDLDHPGIAPVYEVGEAHGSLFIAMKVVDGASLEGRTLEPREAARVVRDAARALQFAHERNVVHRDVKPGNLMLSGADVYVVDFGLARPLAPDSLSVPGAVMGTIPYMSPEQAEGKSVSPRVDVYGLGATLYRLATGRAPIEGGSTLECLQKVRRLEYAAPRRVKPDVPVPLEAIILKAMSEEPRRYATAGALADDLDRWLSGGRVEANPSLGRLRRRARRAVPAVLGAAAIALVAWLALRPGSGRRVEEAHQRLGLARQLVEEARLNLYKKGARFSEQFWQGLGRAAAGAEESLRLHETAEGHYLLGRVYHLQGDYDRALASYDRALALGRTAGPLLAKARAYVEQASDALVAGDEPQGTFLLASARRIFEEVPGLSKRLKEGEIESELVEGWRRIATGDLPGAASFAEARAARHEEFSLILGLARFREGAHREAIRAFTAAIDARPNYYQAFLYRGAVLEGAGEKEFALREYDQALAIHPRYVRALLSRAELRSRLGQTEAARQDWAVALRLRPELQKELKVPR